MQSTEVVSDAERTQPDAAFNNLAPEIWTHILRFLDACSLGRCCSVSRTFQELSDLQSVWRDVCLSTFPRIDSACLQELGQDSWKALYKRLKFLDLSGVWQLQLNVEANNANFPYVTRLWNARGTQHLFGRGRAPWGFFLLSACRWGRYAAVSHAYIENEVVTSYIARVDLDSTLMYAHWKSTWMGAIGCLAAQRNSDARTFPRAMSDMVNSMKLESKNESSFLYMLGTWEAELTLYDGKPFEKFFFHVTQVTHYAASGWVAIPDESGTQPILLMAKQHDMITLTIKSSKYFISAILQAEIAEKPKGENNAIPSLRSIPASSSSAPSALIPHPVMFPSLSSSSSSFSSSSSSSSPRTGAATIAAPATATPASLTSGYDNPNVLIRLYGFFTEARYPGVDGTGVNCGTLKAVRTHCAHSPRSLQGAFP